jgi:branched-chain amino acid transport system ATP-binding protein
VVNGTALLEAQGVTKSFGAVRACDGVDIQVFPDEILGIIGPNGSGKSTLLRMLAGAIRPTSGKILWRGTDVTKWGIDRVARSGLLMTSQNQMVFGGVSVREALEIATTCRSHGRQAPRLSGDALVDLVELGPVLNEIALDLPFGYLRRLGIALALAVQPALLLLDEPAAGLNEAETGSMSALIRQLRDEGIAIGIVDHDMTLMVSLCDRVVVMDAGKKLTEGTPRDVLTDPVVIEVYLGSPLMQETL